MSARYGRYEDPLRRHPAHPLTSHYHGEWTSAWEEGAWEEGDWQKHSSWWGADQRSSLRRRGYEDRDWNVRPAISQGEYVRGRAPNRHEEPAPPRSSAYWRSLAEANRENRRGDGDKTALQPTISTEEEWPTLVNQVTNTASKIGKAWSYVRQRAEIEIVASESRISGRSPVRSRDETLGVSPTVAKDGCCDMQPLDEAAPDEDAPGKSASSSSGQVIVAARRFAKTAEVVVSMTSNSDGRELETPISNASTSAAKAAEAARRIASAAAAAAEAAAKSIKHELRSEEEEEEEKEVSEIDRPEVIIDNDAAMEGASRGRWRGKKNDDHADTASEVPDLANQLQSKTLGYEQSYLRSCSQERYNNLGDDVGEESLDWSMRWLGASCQELRPGDTEPSRILQGLADEVCFLRKTYEKPDAATLMRNAGVLISEAQKFGLPLESSLLAAAASHCARFQNRELLADLIDYAKHRLWSYTGREVAGLAWAAARLQHFDLDFFYPFATYCANAPPHAFDDFQDITKAIRSLAESLRARVPGVDHALAFHGLTVLALEQISRSEGRTSDVAQFAKALSTALHERPLAGGIPLSSTPEVEQAIGLAVRQVRLDLHQSFGATVEAISLTVAAAWHTMEHMRSDELMPCMRDVGQAARFRRYDYSPQNLSAIAGAFSRIGYADLAVADVLNEQTWSNIDNFTWQDFVSIIGGVLRLQGASQSWDDEPFVRSCMSEITSRDLATLEPEDLCKMVQVLVKFSNTLGVVALGRIFDEVVERRRLCGFSPKNKAIIFRAVAAADIMEPFSDALVSATSPFELSGGDACDVLWALAKSWHIFGDRDARLKHEASRLINDIVKSSPWEEADASQVADTIWSLPIVESVIWHSTDYWASLWAAAETVQPSLTGLVSEVVDEIIQLLIGFAGCTEEHAQRGYEAITAFVAKVVEGLHAAGKSISHVDGQALMQAFADGGMDLPRGLQGLFTTGDLNGGGNRRSPSRGKATDLFHTTRRSLHPSRKRLSSPELFARHTASSDLGSSDRRSRSYHDDEFCHYASWGAYGAEASAWGFPGTDMAGAQGFFPPIPLQMGIGLPMTQTYNYVGTSGFNFGVGPCSSTASAEAPGYWGPLVKGYANPYCGHAESGIDLPNDTKDNDDEATRSLRPSRARSCDEVFSPPRASSAPTIEEVLVARYSADKRGSKAEGQMSHEYTFDGAAVQQPTELAVCKELQGEGLQLELPSQPGHFLQTKNTFVHIDVVASQSESSDDNSPPPIRKITRSRSCDDITIFRPRRKSWPENDCRDLGQQGSFQQVMPTSLQRSMSEIPNQHPTARAQIRPPPGLHRRSVPRVASEIRDVPIWLQQDSLKSMAECMSRLSSRSASRAKEDIWPVIEMALPDRSPVTVSPEPAIAPHASSTNEHIAPPASSSTVPAPSATSCLPVEGKVTTLRRLPPGLKPRAKNNA